MTIRPEVLRALKDAGASLDMILAAIEEILSSRPVKRIIIKSQPIEWTANNPVRTT
jgi:hypothetical protein